MILSLALYVALSVQTKEPQPGFLKGTGQHDSGACGWNGDLRNDGRCHVQIRFAEGYPPVTCKVRQPLPEEGHLKEQIVDCTWDSK